MLEVIQGGLDTKPKRIICTVEGCQKKASDSEQKLCGLHIVAVTDETLRLLSPAQRFQLLSIPFNSWLPLYPNELPYGTAAWESMEGPVLFSREALNHLEDFGLVSYESHLLFGEATTPVFSLTYRGRVVVEDLRTLGQSRTSCFQALYGHSWESPVRVQSRYQGAA